MEEWAVMMIGSQFLHAFRRVQENYEWRRPFWTRPAYRGNRETVCCVGRLRRAGDEEDVGEGMVVGNERREASDVGNDNMKKPTMLRLSTSQP
jgi:hypothetical protein